MNYLGDYVEDDTVYFLWSSFASNGASVTRATNGTISVYKDNGTTQSTAGVTDTEDFDSLTGVHAVTIDLSADAFYATGADYAVVLSAATIDGQTVNTPLAHFSIQNRYNPTPPTAAAIADAVWDESTTGHTTSGTFGEQVKTDVDAILADTGTDGVVVASGSKSGYSLAADQSGVTVGTVNALGTQAKADVNAEADTALADYDPPTNAEMEARTLAAASYATAANQTTIAGYIDTEVSAIKAKTDNLPAAPAATGDVPSAAAIATAVLTTAMTEAYSTDGGTVTLAQALYELLQMTQEKAVNSTTLTVKKRDGSTTAMTFTLNDATTPTSITRAT